MLISRLSVNNIVPTNQIELLKNLADSAEFIWKKNLQMDEDFDDMPDEFRGYLRFKK